MKDLKEAADPDFAPTYKLSRDFLVYQKNKPAYCDRIFLNFQLQNAKYYSKKVYESDHLPVILEGEYEIQWLINHIIYNHITSPTVFSTLLFQHPSILTQPHTKISSILVELPWAHSSPALHPSVPAVSPPAPLSVSTLFRHPFSLSLLWLTPSPSSKSPAPHQSSSNSYSLKQCFSSQ